MQETQLVPPDEAVDIMMRLFLSEKFFTESPDLTAQLKEVMLTEKLEQGEDAFLLQLGAAMSHDTLEQVKNITAPTLVITGDLDPMAPVENARFLAEQIPDSTLVELPGVRHAFWVEKFEESSSIITKVSVSIDNCVSDSCLVWLPKNHGSKCPCPSPSTLAPEGRG